MLLSAIEAINFRNLSGKIAWGSRLNIIYGNNGQGKTNWLEAINVLARTKSFRTQRLQEAIRFGETLAIVRGTVTAGESLERHLQVTLQENTKAIFVGEPTGERPNHYGDAAAITLPSSGIEINLSRKYWEDSQPGDPRLWTAPTIPAPLTLQLFRDGRDPALEAIWRYVATPPEKQ